MTSEQIAELVERMQQVRALQFDLVRRLSDLGEFIDRLEADEAKCEMERDSD